MMILRTILPTWLLIFTLPLAARSADIDDPFSTFFAQRQRDGTLLLPATLRRVREQAWGARFRDALLAHFHGQSYQGLELEVAAEAGKTPQKGQPVALEFTIANHGERDLRLVTGGNCHTVHDLFFTVIDPTGRLYAPMGRVPAGGGHCFCSQTESTLAKGASVKLDHHTDRGVIPWEPAAPGRYYVLAEYHLREHGVAYSAPVAVDVQ